MGVWQSDGVKSPQQPLPLQDQAQQDIRDNALALAVARFSAIVRLPYHCSPQPVLSRTYRTYLCPGLSLSPCPANPSPSTSIHRTVTRRTRIQAPRAPTSHLLRRIRPRRNRTRLKPSRIPSFTVPTGRPEEQYRMPPKEDSPPPLPPVPPNSPVLK